MSPAWGLGVTVGSRVAVAVGVGLGVFVGDGSNVADGDGLAVAVGRTSVAAGCGVSATAVSISVVASGVTLRPPKAIPAHTASATRAASTRSAANLINQSGLISVRRLPIACCNLFPSVSSLTQLDGKQTTS